MMRIAIAGCTGRMGRMLVEATCNHEVATLVAMSAEVAQHQQAETLKALHRSDAIITADTKLLLHECDAVIDFTSPEYSLEIAEIAAHKGLVHICGTTGFDAQQLASLQRHANKARIVHAANFSIGVNMLLKTAQDMAARLDDAYDIEIIETHHRFKKDAPSGTALALGEAVAKGRGVALHAVADRARDGITGERTRGAIGFHAVRGGDVIGDHTVLFATLGERIEITHKASDRSIYAQGALHAARWAMPQKAGYYSMQDVLA
jgi:4-hydroxy-tetrahydrodipicolinate reductase